MSDEALDIVIDATRKMAEEDFVSQVAFCYNAGHYAPRSIIAALQRRAVLPRHPAPDVFDAAVQAELDEAVRMIREMVAWPSRTELGRRFWREVDEGRQEGNEARYVGKFALRTMCRSMETVLELESPANDDKRTRTSNAQFKLGSLGFTPTQKHEVGASDDLIRIQREIFTKREPEEKPE